MEDSLMNLELDKFNNDSLKFIKIYQFNEAESIPLN